MALKLMVTVSLEYCGLLKAGGSQGIVGAILFVELLVGCSHSGRHFDKGCDRLVEVEHADALGGAREEQRVVLLGLHVVHEARISLLDPDMLS